MKKIVIFYPHLVEYGGIERNILALSSAIKKRKIKPVLLCLFDKINIKKFDKGLQVHILGKHYNPFVNAARLRFYFEKNKKDIVGMPFFFDEKAIFFSAFNSFFNNYKFVIHSTDPPSITDVAYSKTFLRRLRRSLALYVYKIGVKKGFRRITMTKRNAYDFKKSFGEKYNVVYQGGYYQKSSKYNKRRCKEKKLNLLSVTSLFDNKNLDWLIEAVSYIKNKNLFKSWFKDINLIIVGRGQEREKLIQLTKKMNLSKSVSFTGFIDNNKLEKIYKIADLSLVPGRQGYGLPVLEALYRKIPVVLNKESRISEIFKKNPWVKITNNSKIEFINGLCEHIKKIHFKIPDKNHLKKLPTEEDWSFKIGVCCNWWNK